MTEYTICTQRWLYNPVACAKFRALKISRKLSNGKYHNIKSNWNVKDWRSEGEVLLEGITSG